MNPNPTMFAFSSPIAVSRRAQGHPLEPESRALTQYLGDTKVNLRQMLCFCFQRTSPSLYFQQLRKNSLDSPQVLVP